MEKKKKRISLSFLAIVVIFFQCFFYLFPFSFYFASHYYSASRRTITFLREILDAIPSTGYENIFLSLSFQSSTRLVLKDYVYDKRMRNCD